MTEQKSTLTRRTLLKGGALIPAAMLLGTRRAFAEMPLVDEDDPTAKALGTRRAFAEMPLVDEDDPTAKALGYKHDAGAVDVEKFPKRAGEEGAKQFCDNCSLYNAPAEATKGTCAIFPGKLVKGKGWCNSWVPKA